MTEPEYFWIAVRGNCLPASEMPLTVAKAKRAGVIVGDEGMPTLWKVSPDQDLSAESNYSALIGYATKEGRDASLKTLLESTQGELLEAELERIRREEVCIVRTESVFGSPNGTLFPSDFEPLGDPESLPAASVDGCFARVESLQEVAALTRILKGDGCLIVIIDPKPQRPEILSLLGELGSRFRRKGDIAIFRRRNAG